MNITLRLSEDLGKRAKHLAIDEGKSLSAMVTELLEKKIQETSSGDYAASQQRAWKLIEEGVYGGGARFNRDDCYDR